MKIDIDNNSLLITKQLYYWKAIFKKYASEDRATWSFLQFCYKFLYPISMVRTNVTDEISSTELYRTNEWK
jgi:hypothetical protein